MRFVPPTDCASLYDVEVKARLILVRTLVFVCPISAQERDRDEDTLTEVQTALRQACTRWNSSIMHFFLSRFFATMKQNSHLVRSARSC